MLVGENREDVTVTDGRRRADRFDTDVVCGVADALAPATVGRAGVCRGETDDFERGLSAEIEDGAQFDVVVVVDEPDGFFDAPALRGETPRDLGDSRVERGGEIQRGEAVGGVPTAADRPGAVRSVHGGSGQELDRYR